MEAKRIGLVFDGGGGKGAYQIGVWKALRELGWDREVTAIAGTSVGGLNAALFVQGNYEMAEHIWTNEIKKINLFNIRSVLDGLIDRYIDMSVFSKRNIDCFLATHTPGQTGCYSEPSSDGRSIEKYVNEEMSYYNMRVLSEQDCRIMFHRCSTPKAILLATSALPLLCRKVWIKGKPHQDGGVPLGGDNSPVFPLSFKPLECDNVIVIHLDALAQRQKDLYPGVTTIHEILPNVSAREMGFLRGTLNFDPAHAQRLIDAGYRDSMALFRKFQQSASIRKQEEALERQKKEDNQLLLRMEQELLGDYLRRKPDGTDDSQAV